MDGGETFVPEYSQPGDRFRALIPQGDGGYTVLTDLGLDGGYDTIPGGPDAGTFFINQFRQYTETASHVVDWSQDFVGRANYALVLPATDGGVSTPVTFNLTGFTPIGNQDSVEFTAFNDDAFVDFSLQASVVDDAGNSTFTAGETAITGSVDWSTYAGNYTTDTQAPEVTAGDPFFAAKITATDGGSNGADHFFGLDTFVDLTGQGVSNGIATTLTGTAVVQTPTKPLSTLLTAPSAADLAQFPAGTTFVQYFYDLGAEPAGLEEMYEFVYNDLAYGTIAARLTPAPVSVSFNYANPYPASWDEVFYVNRSFKQPAITVGGGTYDAFAFQTSFDLAKNLAATQSPGMGPVTNIQVNGLSTGTNQGPVGLTPTISWTAPAIGTPTAYRLRLFELAYDATANRVTSQPKGFAYLLPTTTSFTFPPGRFKAGHTYVVLVTAISEPNSDFSTHPARHSLPMEQSGVYTNLLTP